MRKYIDADRLRAEIERRVYDDYNTGEHEIDDIAQGALAGLIPFIDSLQQEQPEDLEGVEFEIGKYMTTNLLKKRNHQTGIFHLTQKDYASIARHFYELGRRCAL